MSTSTLSYRLFIDGEWADSSGDEALDVVNPATEEVIGTVPQATPADVDRAVAAAREAFDEGPWPRMTPRERGAIVLRMGEAFGRRTRCRRRLPGRHPRPRWRCGTVRRAAPGRALGTREGNGHQEPARAA
jgi:hypothetical protein